MGKRLTCNECGGKMRVTNEGVHFYGSSPSPIVKLRCDHCDITRFEQRADIEMELAQSTEPEESNIPSSPPPENLLAYKKWWQFWK